MRVDTESCRPLVLAVLLSIAVTHAAAAQATSLDTPDGMWMDLSTTNLDTIPAKSALPGTIVHPTAYRPLWLDESILEDALRSAPLEHVGDHDQIEKYGVTIWLPMPDGTNIEFAFLESPIMEPGLAEKYPEITTYAGRSLDGSNLYVRFDRTPKGFHAIVLGGRAVYIDPYTKEGVYATYFADDYPEEAEDIGCLVPGSEKNDELSAKVLPAHGDTLRTYRLAVACTGEYANYHGATTPETKGMAVAAIATTVNRITGIYESELAIRLILVATNDLVVFVNPATDPFMGNNNVDVLLNESQTTINGIIGAANYDIGHTFAKANIGGLATAGCVCDNATKAEGVTGSSKPGGDPFDIDFVSHEIGHQFGANHTFNSKKGSCKGNREGAHAYERGSGTTIMSYAGLCRVDNIAGHATPNFHAESLRQIIDYVNSNSCQTNSVTGNTGPLIDAGADYTIPKETAFILTGSGSDTEADPISYSWEELDRGPANTVLDPDNGKSPLFRCFSPSLDPWRIFPELNLILGGIQNGDPLELLPSKARTMTFWLVGRDGRGGIGSDEAKITVNAGSGPFKVTYPNTLVVITGGSKKKVKWDVAKTNQAPVSASHVRILLSTDGGVTFPTVLKDNTPNDGKEKVKFPKTGSLTARVKIEAVGNVFFDISDKNFVIDGGFSFVGAWYMEFDNFGTHVTTLVTFHEDGTFQHCPDPYVSPDCFDGDSYTVEEDDSSTGNISWFGGAHHYNYEVIDNNHVDLYGFVSNTFYGTLTRVQ